MLASPGGVRDPDPMGDMLAGAPELEGSMAPAPAPGVVVVWVGPGAVMMVPRVFIPS